MFFFSSNIRHSFTTECYVPGFSLQNPQQVTHLPPSGIFYFTDRRDQRLVVSLPHRQSELINIIISEPKRKTRPKMTTRYKFVAYFSCRYFKILIYILTSPTVHFFQRTGGLVSG